MFGIFFSFTARLDGIRYYVWNSKTLSNFPAPHITVWNIWGNFLVLNGQLIIVRFCRHCVVEKLSEFCNSVVLKTNTRRLRKIRHEQETIDHRENSDQNRGRRYATAVLVLAINRITSVQSNLEIGNITFVRCGCWAACVHLPRQASSAQRPRRTSASSHTEAVCTSPLKIATSRRVG